MLSKATRKFKLSNTILNKHPSFVKLTQLESSEICWMFLVLQGSVVVLHEAAQP